MVFDKDFTHYATAYSFFSLISDLAYGNETNGWLMFLNMIPRLWKGNIFDWKMI